MDFGSWLVEDHCMVFPPRYRLFNQHYCCLSLRGISSLKISPEAWCLPFLSKTNEKKAAVLLSGTLLGSIFNQDIQLHFPFLLP